MITVTPEHQQRVLDEKAELDTKRSRLAAFIELSPIFGALPGDERGRLVAQYRVMTEYSVILGDRISAF